MPRITIYKSGPLTSSERSRRKREREAALVADGDLRDVSDTGLLEQLARVFLKARKSGARERVEVAQNLLKEAQRRLK
ncbi:MAG: hypothetical protein M0Z85_06225 [Gammaproteobacteria bacterium]|jgi:hypothetical protein|nr:hypothetical protein [Gammaproteobacteria bacterium]